MYEVPELQTQYPDEMTSMFCQAFLTMWLRKPVFITNESLDFHLIQMLSGVGISLKISIRNYDTIAKVGSIIFLFASVFRSQVVQ